MAKQIVLGNMSADLDSAMCAYAIAQVRGAIPLINLPLSQLKNHLDLLFVFELLGINSTKFSYREDIPCLLNSSSQWILVDHNILPPQQEILLNHVVEIIDHHHDEQVNYPQLQKKTIQKTGSCATLVAKQLQSHLDQQLSYGLLLTILLDTAYLQDPFRVTDLDISLVHKLKERVNVDFETYQKLLNLRQTVALPPLDLLRKDYKTYRANDLLYGISSLPLGTDWNYQNTESWYRFLAPFLEEQQIDLLLILIPGEIKRAILFAKDVHLNHPLFIQQTEWVEKQLIFYNLLHPLPRKEIQPILQTLLSDLKLKTSKMTGRSCISTRKTQNSGY